MGERTGISWTDSTWNPWIGCRKVSKGCSNCYAERLVEDRMGRKFTDVVRARNSTFIAPLKWGSLTERTWPGFPSRRVFTCSISDFFIEEADRWRDDAWNIIRATPHLTYQILTKRPERIADHLPRTCFVCGLPKSCHDDGEIEDGHLWSGWPWSNVWLGTSVEDQKYAEKRIPQLLRVPAKVHFLSCEPLLGPIHLTNLNTAPELTLDALTGLETMSEVPAFGPKVDWVIVGGESGPNFRPMDLDWARSIRDQCVAAGVPYFFKQSSGPRSEMDPVLDGREWREMPR